MSWDILPKSNLQYFLQKLKGKFDGKVDIVAGKGLSTNDYTTTEKNKLAGIESGAQVNPTIDSALSSTSTNSVQNKVVKSALDEKADNSDVTETDTPNNTPFLYRKTPYEADRVFLDALVGADIVKNQLMENGNFTDTTGWIVNGNSVTFSVANNEASISTGANAGHGIYCGVGPIIKDHKYLIMFTVKNTANLNVGFSDMTTGRLAVGVNSGYVRIGKIGTFSSDMTYSFFAIYNATATENTVSIKDIICVDLTQEFGSDSIPNNAYTKEQAQSGSGIQWLKDNGFDFSKYIPNNAGTLESVNPSGKKIVWKNLCNAVESIVISGDGNIGEQPCKMPAGTYTYSSYSSNVSAFILYVYYSDGLSNDSFSSSSSLQGFNSVTFTVNKEVSHISCYYNASTIISKIQVEVGSNRTEYEPHTEKTYPITQSPLHGLFKLDNDKIVADGDIRKSDGETARKFTKVDLGSLVWVYQEYPHGSRFASSSLRNLIKKPNSISEYASGMISSRFYAHGDPINNVATTLDKLIAKYVDGDIYIIDTSYTDSTTFKTAMSGVYLIYELATPTTEQLTPFTNPQICYKDGTEEFIDNRTVPVPVGHNSTYANLPSMMDGDFLNYMAKNFASEEYVDTELDTKVDKVAGKGLSTNDYTNEEKALVATIPDKADSDDIKGTQTATGNPITLTDGSETYAQGLSVELEPVQDLHGYDFPWVGGAGKNKLPLTVDGIKAANTDGTWSGNVYTNNGVTFAIQTDSNDNVTGITISGNATDGINFFVASNLILTSASILNLSSDKNTTNNDADFYVGGIGIGSSNWISGSANISADTYQTIGIYVNPNYNDTITIHPMIRLSTETDPTFAPWENICPISGYEWVEVEDVGKNEFDEANYYDLYTNYDYVANSYRCKKIQLKANTTYIVTQRAATTSTVVLLLNSDSFVNGTGYFDCRKAGNSKTYTTGEDGYLYIGTLGNDADTNARLKECKIQIEKGFTATPFEPHQSRTASVTFGQTVYGGSVDVTNGGTDDEFESVDLGSLTWTKDGNDFLSSELSVLMRRPSSVSEAANMLCECFDVKAQSNFETKNGSIAYFYTNSSESVSKVVVYLTDTSLQDFMTIVNGQKLVYEKATPTTISTPPTDLKLLQGTNNLTTNGTTINLDYIPNNSIGDAVKASEEYTDRVVEGKADNTTAYVDLPGNYDTTNKNFPTRSATSGSVENCLTYINDLADKLYTAINSHATALANIPTKTVVVNHRAIDVGDEFNISLPLSYKFLIVELYIYANGECGSIVSTDFANGSVLSIVTNGHGSSYWCDLSRMANRITVDGNFDSTHGELTITAF